MAVRESLLGKTILRGRDEVGDDHLRWKLRAFRGNSRICVETLLQPAMRFGSHGPRGHDGAERLAQPWDVNSLRIQYELVGSSIVLSLKD